MAVRISLLRHRGVRGLDDPYRSTHIEGFWKISVEYRYRYLEHPYISACISASAAGPTLEIAGILQSPLDENNTGFALGPQENRQQYLIIGNNRLTGVMSVCLPSWIKFCVAVRLVLTSVTSVCMQLGSSSTWLLNSYGDFHRVAAVPLPGPAPPPALPGLPALPP